MEDETNSNRDRTSTDRTGDVHTATPYRGDKQLTITEIKRLQQRQVSAAIVYGDEGTVRPGSA